MSTSLTFDHAKDWIRLIFALMGRNRGDMYGGPGTSRYYPMHAGRNNNSRRPPNWRLVISLIALAIVVSLALIWGYLFFHLRPYKSFTANDKVAQVTVVQSREGQHQLDVQVTRFDANGYQKADPHPYLIQGDKVELKYEYVTVPEWLGFLGLHSGYILTGLEGYYNNGATGTYQSLGTPDQDHSPLVSPQYSSITFMPGGKVHTLIISPTGLHEP